MFATTIILGLILRTTSAGFSCPSSSTGTWGNVRMNVVNSGPIGECEREFCFDTNTRVSFPFSSEFSRELISQNCQVNRHQLSIASCTSTTDVVGYDCAMCVCSAGDVNKTHWQEYNTDGRTCQSYLCQELGSSNCSSTVMYAYLPRNFRGADNGMYLASGNLNPASFASSFSEYDQRNYTCPPAVEESCVNNPELTAQYAMNYQAGSFYYLRSNSTNGCIVDKCLPGASGQPGVWDTTTFPPDVEVTANPNLLKFVQNWCPLENNLRLSRCYYSGSPGKMYFAYNSNGCRSSQSSLFCNQFYCDCPSTHPDGGMSWYVPGNSTNSRPSGISGMNTPVPDWTDMTYYCRQYTCQQGSPRNLTAYSGSAGSSIYGGIDPCDPMTGTSSIGEYWAGTSFSNFPQNRRSAVIYQVQGNPNPLGYGIGTSSGTLYYRALENATCAALGEGTCWEVKNYKIDTYSAQGSCPEAGITDPTVVSSCSSPSTSSCDVTTTPRDPVVPQSSFQQNGNYVGTKIQCYAPRQNLVMQPYCMKNDKLQSAYENFDRCINSNANYRFNIEPKAVSGRCTTNFRSRALNEGRCDHPVFQSYISYRANCYCQFVTTLNSGGTTGYNMQSMKAQWKRMINADSGITSLLNTLDNYGCNYVPIQCNGGVASFTITKKVISATMKVGRPCNEVNRFALQRNLNSYWSPSSATSSGPNRYLRILSRTNTGSGNTAACNVRYQAYVRNSVYAQYIAGNLTAGINGNAKAIYESTSGVSVAEMAQIGSASSFALGGLGFLVSLFFLFV